MPRITDAKHIIYKILAYGGALFALAVLQSTFFGHFKIFGAVPDLMLAAVIAVAMREGERAGAVAGTAAGFLVESAGGVGLTILPLYYMLVGYICGICVIYLLRRNFASWSVCALIAYVSRAAVTLIYLGAKIKEVRLIPIFTGTIAPEFFGSLLLAPAVYALIRVCARLFHTKEQLKG